jgi:mitochondrial-processing peptidase subunit alpha
MTVQMPGTISSSEGHSASEPVTKISKLPNGVRVASETSHGLGASIAVFVQYGSVNETAETSGATHFLQHLAFKATEKRSHFMLTREVEKLGAHVAAGASRDCITYAGECLAPNAEALFAVIAETVLYPRIEELDISIAAKLVSQDAANSAKNGGARVLDALHEAAFHGKGLGAPLLSAREHIEPAALQKFLASNISPSRIVVAAVGVEHVRLEAMVSEAFGHLSGSAPALSASKYMGGDYRIPAHLDKGEVHFALGFQGVGVTDKDLLAAAALQSLLGGGDSFSAGGPGKGLTSRIFTNVLCDAVRAPSACGGPFIRGGSATPRSRDRPSSWLSLHPPCAVPARAASLS